MSHLIDLRRELHEHPGIGFDLPETLAIIRRELDEIGVEYTERYGKSSIVATVNPEKTNFTIGVRADIDALPIEEENDVPYRSKNPGKMHACGHDAHTAIALETLRRVYGIRDELPCRVRFFFQAAEEYEVSGAYLMAQDGAMDGVDAIVALHVQPSLDAGDVGLHFGPMNAASNGFRLRFFGKSAHAAEQHLGIDANMAAVRAYSSLEFLFAKEFGSTEMRVFNIGSIHGGKTNNIVSDYCEMFCTLRTWDEEVEERAIRRIREICEGTAALSGARFEFVPVKRIPIVYNHPEIAGKVKAAIIETVGEDHFKLPKRRSGGEDFAFFTRRVPGCMFRLGCRDPKSGITRSLHESTFDVDESCLEVGVGVFMNFILQNRNGITVTTPPYAPGRE